MLPKLSTWMIAALAGAALISGCGGSESTTASTGPSSTHTSTAAAPTRTTILPPTATLPATAPASPPSTTSTASTPPSTSTARTPPPTTTVPSTTGTKTVLKTVPLPDDKISGQQAISVCKGAVHQQPTLSASAKVKLEKNCEKAVAGGQSALSRVAHEVCLEIINASKVPAGASRERALALCSEE
jgi:hypothetical protein